MQIYTWNSLNCQEKNFRYNPTDRSHHNNRLNSFKKNPPSSPFCKGGKRGILHYAPWSLFYAISDCSDLLSHKDEIADPKTENGNGYNRN